MNDCDISDNVVLLHVDLDMNGDKQLSPVTIITDQPGNYLVTAPLPLYSDDHSAAVREVKIARTASAVSLHEPVTVKQLRH